MRQQMMRRTVPMFYGQKSVFVNPASLPGLELWLDADSGVYKDAGVTLAADGETVQQWNDRSPSAHHASQGTAGLRPTYIAASAINNLPALRWSNHRMDTTSFLGSGYNTAWTIFSVSYNSAHAAVTQYMITANTGLGGFDWMHQRYPANLQHQFTTNSLSGTSLNIVCTDTTEIVVDCFSYNGTTKYGGYNGTEVSEAGTGNIGMTGALTIGRWSASAIRPFVGDIRSIVAYNRALSLDERIAVSNWLNTNSGDVYGNASRLIFDGDSLTLGSGSTGGNTYPAQVVASFPKAFSANVAVAGVTIATMITTAAAAVDALKGTIYTGKNVCIAWGGSNDIVAGDSAATVEANIVTYCNARRAAGLKTVILTILPRSAFNAGMETIRGAVNAYIVANWASFADGLADVAANAHLLDYTDTTYFNADKTHLNNTGYGVVAGVVTPVLTALGA